MSNDIEKIINETKFKPINGHLGINDKGHLTICNRDVVDLADKYDTPVFIVNEDMLRSNIRNLRNSFKHYYDNTELCLAYKANSLLAVAKIADSEGTYADVVSGGELYKTKVLNINPKKVIFNGNNKLRKEIAEAIGLEVTINADSISELRMIEEEAKKLNKKANICFRVNPDVSADVIEEFATGIKSSKFGLDIGNGDAYNAYKMAKESPFVNILGIHTHIGSQIEGGKYYSIATEKIMDFVGKLKMDLGIELKIVNMGGGFAIPFDFLDKEIKPDIFAKAITSILIEKIDEYNLNPPQLLVEPGGYLTGNTGIAILKVGTIKQKEKVKKVALDAGSNMLLRATQGWYTYRAVCANKMNDTLMEKVDLVGPICYEGDVLARNRMLPQLKEGDLIAFLDVGAYTVVLMNHYNCRISPSVVLVNSKGEENIIREREKYEDLVSHDKIPDRLNH